MRGNGRKGEREGRRSRERGRGEKEWERGRFEVNLLFYSVLLLARYYKYTIDIPILI